jgi:hypothetical protein
MVTHSFATEPVVLEAIAELRIGEPSPSPSRLTITPNSLEPFAAKSPSKRRNTLVERMPTRSCRLVAVTTAEPRFAPPDAEVRDYNDAT